MSSNSEVFQRKPFKSGDSKVITVTGMPVIPSNGEVNIKPIRLDGNDCLLLTSYQEISRYELEQMPDNIKTGGEDGSELIATRDSVYGMASALAKLDLEVPDGKELALTLRDKTQ